MLSASFKARPAASILPCRWYAVPSLRRWAAALGESAPEASFSREHASRYNSMASSVLPACTNLSASSERRAAFLRGGSAGAPGSSCCSVSAHITTLLATLDQSASTACAIASSTASSDSRAGAGAAAGAEAGLTGSAEASGVKPSRGKLKGASPQLIPK